MHVYIYQSIRVGSADKSVDPTLPANESAVDKFVSLYATALAHPVVKVVLLAGFTGAFEAVVSSRVVSSHVKKGTFLGGDTKPLVTEKHCHTFVFPNAHT